MRVTPFMIVTALVETGTGIVLLVWPALVFALLTPGELGMLTGV